MAPQLIETLIRVLAIVAGILALMAPLLVLGSLSRTGLAAEAEGKDASVRVRRSLLSTVVLLLIGILLWRPVPLGLSDRAGLGLSLLGGLLYFPSVSLYLWGLRALGPVFRTSSVVAASLPADHTLVESGPYRLVRHPMYLGVIFAAAGALLIFRTWAMVVFFPASLVVLVRARREEEALARRHGGVWEAYARRVKPWLPKIW